MSSKLILTPLPIIETPGGEVMHGIKNTDLGFVDFGEAYFSKVNFKAIKGWKKHRKMTLNLLVPYGKIRFVLFDNRQKFAGSFQEIIISKDNYCRLTIPPLIWFAFQGLSEDGAILMNIADIHHSDNEVKKKKLEELEFNWDF